VRLSFAQSRIRAREGRVMDSSPPLQSARSNALRCLQKTVNNGKCASRSTIVVFSPYTRGINYVDVQVVNCSTIYRVLKAGL
jgi:hypothetical protein